MVSSISCGLARLRSLVTGSGRGIGRATALRFAREGAAVVLVARSQTQLEEVASQIAYMKRDCLVLPTDVSKEADVAACFGKVLNDFGQIDILIDNAGISLDRPFLETSLDEWEQVFNVNLRGVVLCTRAVLPSMLANGRGKIVNIASGAGLRGLPGNSAYAASKAAVIALGASLASEVESHGVQVNTICPGPVDTDMLRQSGVRDFVSKSSNLQPPEDVASAALFLASELAGRTSGQVISVRTTNRW